MSCAAARRSSARSSSRATTSSSSSRAAASCFARAPTGARRTCVAAAPHDRAARRSRRPIGWCFASIMRCCMYKLQRRDELDREIERLAELPTLAPMVRRLQCFRGICVARRDGAGDGDRRLAALRAPDATRRAISGLVSREDSSGDRERQGLDHESGQQSLSPRARPSGVELSPSAGRSSAISNDGRWDSRRR